MGALNDAGITRRQEAIARGEALRPLLAEMEAAEMSSRAIATELNKRRIPTPAGGRWQAVRLRRVNRVGAESPSDRALAFRHAGPQYWAVERRGRISPRTGRRQCQSFISILIRCSFGKTRRRHLSAPDAGMRCGLPGSSHQCDHCLGWSFTYADAVATSEPRSANPSRRYRNGSYRSVVHPFFRRWKPGESESQRPNRCHAACTRRVSAAWLAPSQAKL
jgi:hypothetical protein